MRRVVGSGSKKRSSSRVSRAAAVRAEFCWSGGAMAGRRARRGAPGRGRPAARNIVRRGDNWAGRVRVGRGERNGGRGSSTLAEQRGRVRLCPIAEQRLGAGGPLPRG